MTENFHDFVWGKYHGEYKGWQINAYRNTFPFTYWSGEAWINRSRVTAWAANKEACVEKLHKKVDQYIEEAPGFRGVGKAPDEGTLRPTPNRRG